MTRIKVFLRHFFSLIQIIQASGKLDCLRHLLVCKIAFFSIRFKDLSIVGIYRILPAEIVTSKLIDHTVFIGISGHFLADTIHGIPVPVRIGQGDSFLCQKGFIHKHQRRNCLIGKCILHISVLSAPECTAVIFFCFKIRVFFHQRFQIFHNAHG